MSTAGLMSYSLKLLLIVLTTAVAIIVFTLSILTVIPIQYHRPDDLLFNDSANEEDKVQKRLSDVFFSIKSTAIHDFTRLPPSVLTWLRNVPTKNVCRCI